PAGSARLLRFDPQRLAFQAPKIGLKNLADRLAVALDVADRAVRAVRGLLHSLGVGRRQDVLLLDDDAAALGQLVDSVQFHRERPSLPARRQPSNPVAGVNRFQDLGWSSRGRRRTTFSSAVNRPAKAAASALWPNGLA